MHQRDIGISLHEMGKVSSQYLHQIVQREKLPILSLSVDPLYHHQIFYIIIENTMELYRNQWNSPDFHSVPSNSIEFYIVR